MRIGLVTQSYYPRYGGVTEHVHALAVELRRRGHAVTILTSRFRRGESGGDADVRRIGYNILIPFNRAFVDFTVGLRLKGGLRRAIRELDLDLVHVHCPMAPSLPVLAVLASDRPTVGTFHSTGGRTALQDFFRPLLHRVVGRLDGRIAVSVTAQRTAEIYHPGPYHVIPNGVDVDRFHPLVPPFPEWRTPDVTNILFVGRLDPRKGVHDLIRALPEVLERTDGRVRLLVVGDSYLRPQIESEVPSSARHHVHFLGHVSSADLPRWYATGDLFCSPATGNESFGIVLVEAMAAGRALVCSDIPGYRTVVTPGRDAATFPAGDVRALARTLAQLIEDPERRGRFAAAGRQRALDFAWPRVVDAIEAVYREAVGRRRGALTGHTAA
ncbi:MAG TPA: glycosyltransferase family 4 protein [Candidatus Eisenbacteria bacterium]|nr:glycosyltransferase family 4 protein [Candidatus Eisenbacteria bacterium]